jgi:hypothetical protein
MAAEALAAEALAVEGCDQPPQATFADINEARPLSFLGSARTGTGLQASLAIVQRLR